MKKMFLESKNGYFGEEDSKFGGCFIPETLYSAIKELQKAYKEIFKSKEFKKELKGYYKSFVGRPTPLIYAKNVSEMLGNEIYLKFEGLANTGAHKINNALAQALLAKKMGKTHIIAETGAGQHGLATAAVCAFLKLPCKIFMGEIDIARQRPNVFIMQQFGAEVVSVKSGSKTLKDAVNEALREWSKNPDSSFYVLGSALGPYPYPDIVRDAQSIIGKEIKKQIRKALGVLPHYVIACVGGGSNALGAFSAFLEDKEVRLIGVEAGGEDFIDGKNAMRLSPQSKARVGIAHGYKSFFLQDNNGQIAPTHSISAGLDYAGVSPQLAHLHDIGRVEFMAASDKEALAAMQFFARHEGILAALESSHALSGVINLTKKMSNKIIVVNVSGRGDKDIFITAKRLCKDEWKAFLQSEIDSMQSRPAIFMPVKECETFEDSGFKIVAEEFKNDLQDIAHEGLRFIDSASKAESNKAFNKADASVESSDDLSLEDLEGEELIQEVNDEIEEIFEQIDSIKEQIDSKEKAENLKNVIQDTISDIESNCACGAVDSIDSALDSVDSLNAVDSIDSTDSIDSVNESEKATALESALDSALESSLETNLDSALDSNLDSALESNMESSLETNLESDLDSALDSNLDSALESNLESFEPEPIIEPETATEITPEIAPEITPKPNIESKQDSKHYDLLHFLDSKDKKSIEKKHLNKSHFSLLEFLDPHGKLTESKKDSKQENIESNQTLESNKAQDFIDSTDSITQDSIKVDSTDSIKQDSINSTKADSIESKKQDSKPQTQNLAQELQSELATHGDLDFSFLDKDDTQDSKDSNTQNIESKSNNTDSNHTTPSDTSTDSSDLDSNDAINSNESHNAPSNADSNDVDFNESHAPNDKDSSNVDSSNVDSSDALVNSSDSHAPTSDTDSIDIDSSDSYSTTSDKDSSDTDSIDTDFIDIDSIDLDSSESHAPNDKDSSNVDSIDLDSSDADSINADSIDALVNSSDSHVAVSNADSSDSKNDADIIAGMFEDVLLKDSLDSMDEDEYEIGDYCDLEDKLHLDTLEDDLTFATTNSTLESNLDSPLDSTLDSNLDLPLDSKKTLESILDSTDNLESSLDSSLNSSDDSPLNSNLDLDSSETLESTLDLENTADSIESNLNLALDLDSTETLESNLDLSLDSSNNIDLNFETNLDSATSTLDFNVDSTLDNPTDLDLSIDLRQDSTPQSIDLDFGNLDSSTDLSLDLSPNDENIADIDFNFDTESMQDSSANIESNAESTQDSNQNIESKPDITAQNKAKVFETHKDLSKICGKSLNA